MLHRSSIPAQPLTCNQKLLEPVVQLAKSSKCPHSDLMPHLVRVISQLWRTMVSGIGEPSILWASPESLIPLRLNAFATLLHVVSSASHHLAKTGLRQLDGSTKWNLTALGKVLSMLFDEHAIMGGPFEDLSVKGEPMKPSPTTSTSKVIPLKKPTMLSRSKTSNEPGMFSAPKPEIIQRFSSEESHKKFDVDAMLQSSRSYEGGKSSELIVNDNDDLLVTSGDSGFKVDSKNDFLSALRVAQSLESNIDVSPKSNTSNRNADLINALGSMGGGQGNRRRWMTLPAMATIQENDTDESRAGAPASTEAPPISRVQEKGDTLDSELILHTAKTKSKQMRVPQMEKSDNISGISSFLDDMTPTMVKIVEEPEKGKEIKPPSDKQKSLPANDDDIESAGSAFLDVISKSIGFQG